MSSRTSRNLLIAAVTSSILFGGVLAFRRTWIGHTIWPPKPVPTSSDVPVFITPRGLTKSLDSIYLRVRSADDDSILLTRGETWVDLPEVPDLWPVYRYDPHTRTIRKVNQVDWTSGVERVMKPRRGRSPEGFSWRQVDGIMEYTIGRKPYRPFETTGDFAIDLTFKPGRKVICVLTADGPVRPASPGPGMIFGTVGGGYYGQHYLEFFQIPDMTRVREAVRIPFTTVAGLGEPCWSPKGRFLVYPNRDGTRHVIIHVYEEGQKP